MTTTLLRPPAPAPAPALVHSGRRAAALLLAGLWAALWTASGAQAQTAATPSSTCDVAAITGQAWRLEGGAPQALKVGDRLGEGTQLRTGEAGRLRLRCPDGSTLVLGDRSQLTLARLHLPAGQPREVSLLLQLGLLGQKVAPAGGSGGSGGKWEVRTPSAVTAVRGTEFMVEVGADEQTAVHVQSGQVAVLPGERAAGKTRGLRLPIVVDPAGGTQCDVQQGCEAAKVWREDRVRSLLDRLAGV